MGLAGIFQSSDRSEQGRLNWHLDQAFSTSVCVALV
jgi:hypothetical protein